MNNINKFVSILVFVVISSVMTSISILLNNYTSPIVNDKNISYAESIRSEMIPSAVQFRNLKSQNPSVVSLIGISKNNLTSGYVFETTAGLCGNNVRIIVGVAPNGRITNIKLMDTNEISTIVNKLLNKLLNKEFLNQFSYNIRRNYIPNVNNIVPMTQSITESIRKIACEFDVIRDKNYRGE